MSINDDEVNMKISDVTGTFEAFWVMFHIAQNEKRRTIQINPPHQEILPQSSIDDTQMRTTIKNRQRLLERLSQIANHNQQHSKVFCKCWWIELLNSGTQNE